MTLLQGVSSLQKLAERWVLTNPLISTLFYEGTHLLQQPWVTANDVIPVLLDSKHWTSIKFAIRFK